MLLLKAQRLRRRFVLWTAFSYLFYVFLKYQLYSFDALRPRRAPTFWPAESRQRLAKEGCAPFGIPPGVRARVPSAQPREGTAEPAAASRRRASAPDCVGFAAIYDGTHSRALRAGKRNVKIRIYLACHSRRRMRRPKSQNKTAKASASLTRKLQPRSGEKFRRPLARFAGAARVQREDSGRIPKGGGSLPLACSFASFSAGAEKEGPPRGPSASKEENQNYKERLQKDKSVRTESPGRHRSKISTERALKIKKGLLPFC